MKMDYKNLVNFLSANGNALISEHSLHGDSLQHYLSQMDGFQMRS